MTDAHVISADSVIVIGFIRIFCYLVIRSDTSTDTGGNNIGQIAFYNFYKSADYVYSTICNIRYSYYFSEDYNQVYADEYINRLKFIEISF